MLTSEDAKLERLKFAILFTIAGMFWVEKTDACYKRIQKFRNINFIHPSYFIQPCKKLIHPGVNHSPG